MEYKDIERVNSEINTIPLKGKEYAMVPDRVTAFRKLYPEGFITTEIVSHDGSVVLMQAKVGYYDEEGNPVVLGTGFAQEVKGIGMVNKTSYIENCETSAVGRALGFISLGLGGGGICSAEELVNAITAQNQMNNAGEPFTRPTQQAQVDVSSAQTVPPIEKPEEPAPAVQIPPAMKYLGEKRKMLQEMRKLDPQKNKKLFDAQLDALRQAGLAPTKALSQYTMEEAEALIDAMMKNFPTDSAELIKK